MNIRKAEPKDFDKIMELLIDIAEIHGQGRPDIFADVKVSKYDKAQLAEIIADENRPIFVAVDENDSVAGYAFCMGKTYNHPVMKGHSALYIDDLCVDKTCRGQHVGTELFAYIKDYAKENGFFNIELNVWEFNEDAVRFYEKCGMTTQRRNMEIVLWSPSCAK